jgi:hypothetical protein
MKTTSAEVDSFIKRFLAAQDKMRILLERVPHGCQNWSYQKSVNFKSLTKKKPSYTKIETISQAC